MYDKIHYKLKKKKKKKIKKNSNKIEALVKDWRNGCKWRHSEGCRCLLVSKAVSTFSGNAGCN